MMLDQARELKRRLDSSATLIMNDRADFASRRASMECTSGRTTCPLKERSKVIGADSGWGFPPTIPHQLAEADLGTADYLAIGPVFPTQSKANPDPVIGLEGVRQARALTRKPLVAIGGITRENCRLVIEAGADAVAVISDLIREPRKSAEEFFRILR